MFAEYRRFLTIWFAIMLHYLGNMRSCIHGMSSSYEILNISPYSLRHKTDLTNHFCFVPQYLFRCNLNKYWEQNLSWNRLISEMVHVDVKYFSPIFTVCSCIAILLIPCLSCIHSGSSDSTKGAKTDHISNNHYIINSFFLVLWHYY